MVSTLHHHDAAVTLGCRLLIAHPDASRILAEKRTPGWGLPALTPMEQHPAAVHHINRAVARRYGLRTVVRRRISEMTHEAPDLRITRYYELETVDDLARQRISRTAWAGRDVIGEMEFPDTSDLEAIERWLDGSEGDSAATERPPWSQPGWYLSAVAWMRPHAAAAGWTGETEPEQHWTDTELAVLRIEADDFTLYMEAASRPGPPHTALWPEPDADDREIGMIAEDATRNWSLYRVG